MQKSIIFYLKNFIFLNEMQRRKKETCNKILVFEMLP